MVLQACSNSRTKTSLHICSDWSGLWLFIYNVLDSVDSTNLRGRPVQSAQIQSLPCVFSAHKHLKGKWLVMEAYMLIILGHFFCIYVFINSPWKCILWLLIRITSLSSFLWVPKPMLLWWTEENHLRTIFNYSSRNLLVDLPSCSLTNQLTISKLRDFYLTYSND